LGFGLRFNVFIYKAAGQKDFGKNMRSLFVTERLINRVNVIFISKYSLIQYLNIYISSGVNTIKEIVFLQISKLNTLLQFQLYIKTKFLL